MSIPPNIIPPPAALYVLNTTTGQWQPATSLGTGPAGPPGAAATVTVGTTTTGAAGTNATVTNSGSTSAAVFNFTIPQGAQGLQGIQGPQGVAPANVVITNPSATQTITQPAGTSLTVSGGTGITAPGFSGPLTGNVTGTASGNVALNPSAGQTVNQPSNTNFINQTNGANSSAISQYGALVATGQAGGSPTVATSWPLFNSQPGAYIMYNWYGASGGGGAFNHEMDFVCQNAGVLGGFAWYNANSSGIMGNVLMLLNPNGPTLQVNSVTCTNLSCTGGTKTFVIDHPLLPDKSLVHACLEGPENAVYYRGEAQLVNGSAVVELPDYFETLTRGEGRTVILTAKFEGEEEISCLAASSVKSGKFRVRGIDGLNPQQKFFWEVKAVRADLVPLEIVKDREANL